MYLPVVEVSDFIASTYNSFVFAEIVEAPRTFTLGALAAVCSCKVRHTYRVLLARPLASCHEKFGPLAIL
jgi:hypothetical protein